MDTEIGSYGTVPYAAGKVRKIEIFSNIRARFSRLRGPGAPIKKPGVKGRVAKRAFFPALFSRSITDRQKTLMCSGGTNNNQRSCTLL